MGKVVLPDFTARHLHPLYFYNLHVATTIVVKIIPRHSKEIKMEILCEAASNTVIDALDCKATNFLGKHDCLDCHRTHYGGF